MANDKADAPREGEDRIRTIERWRRQPIKASCLGIGCGPLLVILALIALVWYLVR